MKNEQVTGELKVHTFRNYLLKTIQDAKDKFAAQLFEQYYMGSDPDELSLVVYLAKKFEKGEIKVDYPIQVTVVPQGDKDNPDGFIFKFTDIHGNEFDLDG